MFHVSVKILVTLVLLITLGCAVWYLDPAMSEALDWAMLIANLIPLLLLLLIFYGITRRIGLSFVVVGLLSWALFLINEQKLLNLDEPLIFADVYLVPQMVSGWGLMRKYMDVYSVIIGVVVFIAAAVVLFRFERPGLKLRYGVLLMLVGVGGFVFIVQGSQGPQAYYGSRSSDARPWMFSSLAENQGLLASLVTGARLTRFVRPVFNEQAIDTFLSEYGLRPADDIHSQPPDIILWLSESFFDTQVLNDIAPCETWLLFCDIKSSGVAASIGVSTFGGNTTRTEFEVLTGVPFSMLDGHDYPYISVVNSQTQSIVWELLLRGYKTIAVHPHEGTFWQRHRALPLLGFQQFDDNETFKGATRSGYYISDRDLKDRVVSYLKMAEEPAFLFAISMENHGPWGLGTRQGLNSERFNAIAVPPALDDKEAQAWREYVYHGENSLNELAELYEFIVTRERPTLIVFFGDHLPGLTPVFVRLGFKDGRSAPSQPVPVIALANYPLQPDWIPRYAHDLGVWTLHLAGQLGEGSFAEMNAALSQLRAGEEAPAGASEALEAMQTRVLATQGNAELAPVRTFRKPRQSVAMVPESEHLRDATARGEAESIFCPVESWGPRVTEPGVAANEQPDGSMGVWMKTDCFPVGADVFLDSERLRVTRTDFGVTTSVPVPLLAEPGEKALYFFDRTTREKHTVGHILVE